MVRSGGVPWAFVVVKHRGAMSSRSEEGPVPAGEDALDVVKGRDNDLPTSDPPSEQKVVRTGSGMGEELVKWRLGRPGLRNQGGNPKRCGQSECKIIHRVKGERVQYSVGRLVGDQRSEAGLRRDLVENTSSLPATWGEQPGMRPNQTFKSIQAELLPTFLFDRGLSLMMTA